MLSQSLFLPDRVTLMGVVNVTPDSFSDGGQFVGGAGDVDCSGVVRHAQQLVQEGAHAVDVGGESTRPGAAPVPLEVEERRVVPAIERICAELDVPVSVDTRNAAVARQAIRVGARIVNDVSGLTHDPALAECVAESEALLILGHMRGTPVDMQSAPHYDDVLREVVDELESSLQRARKAGVSDRRICVDPGIGFGKRLSDNLALMAHVDWMRERLGVPVMVGPSRKSFIEAVTGDPVGSRDEATAASCAVLAFAGVDAVRVHDVRRARKAVLMGRAMGKMRRKSVT
ncbi:dihydropteroate synthase [Myxococcota bacterium]|nr:dihydropteroate synthase [Myxococcota bacterium]